MLDADALFALAAEPELFGLLTARDVLTPHPGEAAALLGMTAAEVQADRFVAHARLRALAPACWVLKGEGSLSGAAGGPVCLSPWSVPQLAVGGSGDVLAGVIGALLASGRDAASAAALGVELHARAGAALAKTWPERGNGPREIADAVPSRWRPWAFRIPARRWRFHARRMSCGHTSTDGVIIWPGCWIMPGKRKPWAGLSAKN